MTKSQKNKKKKKSSRKPRRRNEYGIMPIHRSKYQPRHPHVVILQGKKENISVGLTTENSRGDLIPVKYSNGETAFMKRTAARQSNNLYASKEEKYKLDKVSEHKAYEIAVRKMLGDIGKTDKNKKRNC